MVSRLILGAVLLLWAAPSWGAISFDTFTVNDNADSDTSTSFSHTIGTGANVYVGVCVVTRNATSSTVSSLTINGGAATSQASADATASGQAVRVEYWDRVLGSTNGAVTIDVTVSGADRFRTTAFSLFGVNQSSPVGTVPTGIQGFGTSLDLTVSSATNDLIMGCLATATSGTSALTVGSGETQRWSNSTDVNNTYELGLSEDGAASVHLIPTWTGTNYSVLVGVPVKPAPDGQPTLLRGLSVPGMNSLGLGGPLP